MSKLDDLAASIGQRHAYIEAAIKHQGQDLVALYAEVQKLKAPPPPPASAPASFGCRVPLEALTDWSVQLVEGGGKPPSVPLWGTGGTMKRFRFHSQQPGFYVGPNGWAADKPPVHPVVARDVYVGPGFSKWASNGDGVREELVEYLTVEGILPTPGGFEHGCYRKLQGGGDVSKSSLVRRHCLYRNIAGAGVQLGHRDFWIHGGPFGPGAAHPKQECADPATCFSPTGPLVIEHNRFERCSAAFDAASLSIHAPQKWDAGGKMPPACQNATIHANEFDNASTVVASDLLYNTPLFIAGRRSVRVTENEIRRRSSIRTSTSTLRPLVQLGDPFHPGTTWGTPFAPVVEVGGLLVFEWNKLWTDEPTTIDLWLEVGAGVEWASNELSPGSAPVTLRLNGQAIGPATQSLFGTVQARDDGRLVIL